MKHKGTVRFIYGKLPRQVIELGVSDWTQKPLKMLVEGALTARLIPAEKYRRLSKAEKKQLKKKVINRVNLSEVEVVVEEAILDSKVRTTSDWDSFVREKNYAKKLGVEIPMSRKTNKLYNKNLMFHNIMQPIDYVINITNVEDHKVEDVVDESKSFLVEPLYAMGRRMKETPKITLWTKVGKSVKELGTFTAEDLDERPHKRVLSEESSRYEFTRTRNFDKTIFEGVYDFDQEIRPLRVDFVDWAYALHYETQIDVGILIDELKEFYYNHPKVVKELKEYYNKNAEVFSLMPSVETDEVESVVSYGKFISILKETNEPAARKVELEEVVEDYLEEKGINLENLR